MIAPSIVQTAYGEATVVATSPDHIHFSASNGGTPARNLTVRKIPYHVSAHLYRRSDGSWHVGREQHERGEWARLGDNLYATRTDKFTFDQASDSAKRALREEAERVVTAWAATDEGRAAIAAGARQSATFELGRVARELTEAQAKVRELEDRYVNLTASLLGDAR